MGIEADIILFHPYDRWGFSLMTEQQDLYYMRYITARLSAYHNVWWSLANEYDLMNKSDAQWVRIANVLCEHDPYRHMRSIHNCRDIYDFSRPWCTHCSIQRNYTYLHVENTNKWREQYRKPVVLDEISYEGNVPFGWGNISGEEMLRRFWETMLRGGYPGHGDFGGRTAESCTARATSALPSCGTSSPSARESSCVPPTKAATTA